MDDSEISFGIPFREWWSIGRVRAYTRLHCELWIDNVYNYNDIYKEVALRTRTYNIKSREFETQELDPFIWEEWTKLFEESRQFVLESFMDFGINEAEAHFLSIKFAKSVISKFRLKMFIDFGGQEGKEEFQRTALRNAINCLHLRFELMSVRDKYLWSVKAADERVGQFRRAAAQETVNLLVEETGAILHAKLML